MKPLFIITMIIVTAGCRDNKIPTIRVPRDSTVVLPAGTRANVVIEKSDSGVFIFQAAVKKNDSLVINNRIK